MSECKPVYFSQKGMPNPEYNYVCWLDVMGTKNQMLRSLPVSANFIFKLHCAVLDEFDHLATDDQEALWFYPLVDGIYLTASNRQPLTNLLARSLRRLIETFLQEKTLHHRFFVRGAIAFGPVVHGDSVTKDASWVIEKHRATFNSILMGLPMAQAFETERSAPPFGIAIDESARGFAPPGDSPFRFIWWDWFSSPAGPYLQVDPKAILSGLDDYFDWQKRHTNTTGYDLVRLERHRQLAHEYFGKDSIFRKTNRQEMVARSTDEVELKPELQGAQSIPQDDVEHTTDA
jgi:hypothetical protein